MLTAADLPDDIAALKALLLASERRIQERDDQVAGLEAQLNTRAAEIEHLKLWIAKLRRMQFGRKSEKLDHQIEQLELQLEDLQADEGVPRWPGTSPRSMHGSQKEKLKTHKPRHPRRTGVRPRKFAIRRDYSLVHRSTMSAQSCSIARRCSAYSALL